MKEQVTLKNIFLDDDSFEEEQGPKNKKNEELLKSFEEKEVKVRFDNDKGYIIYLKAGREEIETTVSESEAKSLLNSEVEKWRAVNAYNGFFNSDDSIVEVFIRTSSSMNSMRLYRLRDLIFNINGRCTATIVEPSEIPLKFGRPVFLRNHPSPGLVVRIQGASVKTKDDAEKLIEKVVGSLSVYLWQITGKVIQAEKASRREALPRDRYSRRRVAIGSSEVIDLKNQYPNPVSTLLQSGSDRFLSPVIRYWALYQIIEYYFPRYSNEEMIKKVQGVVKKSTFNPHDINDIEQILSVTIGSTNGKPLSEKDQLISVLRATLDVSEIVKRVDEHNLTKSFRKNDDAISNVSINFSDTSTLVEKLASRIYDIRCKIVHSKNFGKDSENIIPGSIAEDRIGEDLLLLEILISIIVDVSAEMLQIN